jgi:hypothetical protein
MKNATSCASESPWPFPELQCQQGKDKGTFKKMIQKHFWNWMKQKAKSKCTRAAWLLARWITGCCCSGGSELSLQRLAPLFTPQQLGIDKGPESINHPEHRALGFQSLLPPTAQLGTTSYQVASVPPQADMDLKSGCEWSDNHPPTPSIHVLLLLRVPNHSGVIMQVGRGSGKWNLFWSEL